MKCRACWSDKAYLRPIKGWQAVVHKCLGLVPLKCHHCYHKFALPWLFTLGKPLAPPPLKLAEGTECVAPRRRAAHAPHALPASHAERKAA